MPRIEFVGKSSFIAVGPGRIEWVDGRRRRAVEEHVRPPISGFDGGYGRECLWAIAINQFRIVQLKLENKHIRIYVQRRDKHPLW